MQLLEPGVNWSGFLSAATDLAWLACLVACGVASALILCCVSMLVSEIGPRRLLLRREFMGYGVAIPRHRMGLTSHTPALRGTRPSVVRVQGFLQRRVNA